MLWFIWGCGHGEMGGLRIAEKTESLEVKSRVGFAKSKLSWTGTFRAVPTTPPQEHSVPEINCRKFPTQIIRHRAGKRQSPGLSYRPRIPQKLDESTEAQAIWVGPSGPTGPVVTLGPRAREDRGLQRTMTMRMTQAVGLRENQGGTYPPPKFAVLAVQRRFEVQLVSSSRPRNNTDDHR
jgi:hypothetical protein